MLGLKWRRPAPATITNTHLISGCWDHRGLALSFLSSKKSEPMVKVRLDPVQVTDLLLLLADEPGHVRAPDLPDPPDFNDRAATDALGHTSTCVTCLNNYFRTNFGDATPFSPIRVDNEMMMPLARALVKQVVRHQDDPTLTEALSMMYVAVCAGLDQGKFFTEEK